MHRSVLVRISHARLGHQVLIIAKRAVKLKTNSLKIKLHLHTPRGGELWLGSHVLCWEVIDYESFLRVYNEELGGLGSSPDSSFNLLGITGPASSVSKVPNSSPGKQRNRHWVCHPEDSMNMLSRLSLKPQAAQCNRNAEAMESWH